MKISLSFLCFKPWQYLKWNKLWQAQRMANDLMHFDVLAKHRPVNSKKYAALLSILIKGFENRFQDLWKVINIFGIFVTPFSVDINTLPAHFQMKCVELQSAIQVKDLISSCYWTLTRSALTEKNIPCFTIMPYSHHCFLTVCALVSSCFQGWITGRIIFHQNSLTSTVRTH